MDKWLKKILPKKPWIEDNANYASTSQQQNVRTNTSLTPGRSSSSATLWGKKNNDELIRSDKKLAKKNSKLSRQLFEIWIYFRRH